MFILDNFLVFGVALSVFLMFFAGGLIALGLYFTPAIVGAYRKHNQILPILLLNIFLGWTLLGWVVALVWALNDDVTQKAQ